MYIRIEEKTLNELKDRGIKSCCSDENIMPTDIVTFETHLESRLKLLKNLKYDLIG